MNLSPTSLEEIIELLIACDDAYFNADESPLSDRDYDLLKRKAMSMDRGHEYFVKIGSDVRGGKIKLPYQMGSLNQIYEGEAQEWVKKYSLGNKKVTVTHKLDGVSCLLVYNSGTLSIAYSRGNGIEGADITRHLKAIPSVPKAVPADYMVVRAEVIMANETFSDLYASQFKNPRNMVAGALNRKETDATILKNLSVIAYEIVDAAIGSDKQIHKRTKTETLEILEKFGFAKAEGFQTPASNLTDDFLSKHLELARSRSDFELDGLVITIDDHASIDTQSTSSSLNPEHSVKYKVLDAASVVETFVKAVHWEVSKSGYLKPRVEILPVELFGTTVKFATGFNAGFIKTSGIGKGAKIQITKSGMVIPYIVGVVTPATPDLPDATEFGAWEFNENGVEAVLVDMEADAIVFKQVLSFFETFKVDLLKEATLVTVWKSLPVKTYEDAICDICDLTESEWMRLIGVNGSKIYSSLRDRLGNAQPATFFGACRYMGVGFGVRKATALLRDITDLDAAFALTEAQIVDKEGFDTKSARMVVAGLPATKALLERLMDMNVLNFVEEQRTTEMTDINLVMTGFRDAQLQADIESRGGKVSSGVSKNTTHLLAINPNSGSSKLEKAKALGVKVMTPDQFKQEYNL